MAVGVTVLLAAGAGCPLADDESLTLLRIESPRFVFLQHCSRCHEPGRAYRAAFDGATWRQTVHRMAGWHNTYIDRESEERIVGYLGDIAAYREAFFAARCSRCHSREELGARVDGGADCCGRMGAAPREAAGAVTGEECALILSGLAPAGALFP